MASQEGSKVPARVRPAVAAADAVEALLRDFDPDLTTPRECAELVGLFSKIEHLASAGVAMAAHRVAGAERLWRSGGHRSAAHWLAMQTGMTVTQAVALLKTAEVMPEAPQTTEAMLSGELSTQEALATGQAELADPEAAGELIDKAVEGTTSVRELAEESSRIINAASTETDAQKAERIRRNRSLRAGSNPDGSGWGRWNLPAAEHARLMAALEDRRRRIFTEARRAGVHEPAEAYLADALMALLDGATRRRSGAAGAPGEGDAAGSGGRGAGRRGGVGGSAGVGRRGGAGGRGGAGQGSETGRAREADGDAEASGRARAGGPGGAGQGSDTGRAGEADGDAGAGRGCATGRPEAAATDADADAGAGADPGADTWDFAKVIVRVDAAALERGELAPGELCEIAGQGPVPVASVREMVAGGAFVAALSTRGTEIERVVHLGRRATVLQRTVLEWQTGGSCVIEGCTSTARLEIDHVADWADTRVTRISDLAGVCGHHHDLKTHHGYAFGPRQPNGKRRLIPPESSHPPGPSRWDPDVVHLAHEDGWHRDDWHRPADRRARCDREQSHQGDLFDTG